MARGEVVVLGVNGHLGRAVAQAFVAAGWQVAGMARKAPEGLAGVRHVYGDANDVASLRAAIGDADVVVNALNLPYHQWDQGRMEAQMARVVDAMGHSGKTMLFPGNIYNYARTDRTVTPLLVQRPQTPRGAIRVRVEEGLRAAAARGDIQVIVLRAGDFYGPGSTGDWFDQAIMTGVKKGVVQLLGTSGVGHSWAYLPDLARAFECLAVLRSNLSPFENFHFAGHYVTPEQMGEAIAKAAPGPVRLKRFPHWVVPLIGLFNPVMREIGKMDYLWRNPMELRDERLAQLLGEGFDTPFAAAIAATVGPHLRTLAAPEGARPVQTAA